MDIGGAKKNRQPIVDKDSACAVIHALHIRKSGLLQIVNVVEDFMAFGNVPDRLSAKDLFEQAKRRLVKEIPRLIEYTVVHKQKTTLLDVSFQIILLVITQIKAPFGRHEEKGIASEFVQIRKVHHGIELVFST